MPNVRIMVTVLLVATISADAADWVVNATLDRSFRDLTTADSRVVAYAEGKIASSVDGITWSNPVVPDFPHFTSLFPSVRGCCVPN
ncbi:MAG: hypothetical protein QNL68_14350 [Akkermansiaceae bacterium]|jgi:hypothetical protein